MSRVVLEQVSRRFGPVVAVDDVNLDVASGEFLTLLGPSGCGKTTTLRMIAGLEQNTGGRIAIGDRIVSDAARGVFQPPERRGLGMVFQSYAIWPHMTVFENVAYPLRVRRSRGVDIRERVTNALRLVEMEAYADRPAPALSGGQQQRVAIARALVVEPAVLLLDEPLSNLDARLRAQMGVEFRALQRRLNITSIYVTHDQEEAMSLSDRIVVMQTGRILQIGAPEDIYQRPHSKAVASFFGSPNLLSVTVQGCGGLGDGRYELSVAGEGWTGLCLAGQPFEVGSSAVVVVRPENIAVADHGAVPDGAGIYLSGRATESVFRGARRSITFDVNGQTLFAEMPATTAIGEVSTLVIDERCAWALPA